MKTYVRTLILASTIALPNGAHAQRAAALVPPPVPDEIQVAPEDYTPYLAAHAIGTQGYVCVAVDAAFTWTPFGPQATLFDEKRQQILTHSLSRTPYSLLLNPAWQHSRDSSIVWAQVIRTSSDRDFVAPGAIPWLLLRAVVVGDGDVGGDKLLATRLIQRVNTVGGMPPSTGCSGPDDSRNGRSCRTKPTTSSTRPSTTLTASSRCFSRLRQSRFPAVAPVVRHDTRRAVARRLQFESQTVLAFGYSLCSPASRTRLHGSTEC